MGILKMPPFCRVRLLTGDEHAHSFCRCVDSSVNRLRMLHFNRQIHTCYHNFFLLNKESLKAATLSILIWAYPRETKTNNGNFNNAAILPSDVAYR